MLLILLCLILLPYSYAVDNNEKSNDVNGEDRVYINTKYGADHIPDDIYINPKFLNQAGAIAGGELPTIITPPVPIIPTIATDATETQNIGAVDGTNSMIMTPIIGDTNGIVTTPTNVGIQSPQFDQSNLNNGFQNNFSTQEGFSGMNNGFNNSGNNNFLNQNGFNNDYQNGINNYQDNGNFSQNSFNDGFQNGFNQSGDSYSNQNSDFTLQSNYNNGLQGDDINNPNNFNQEQNNNFGSQSDFNSQDTEIIDRNNFNQEQSNNFGSQSDFNDNEPDGKQYVQSEDQIKSTQRESNNSAMRRQADNNHRTQGEKIKKSSIQEAYEDSDKNNDDNFDQKQTLDRKSNHSKSQNSPTKQIDRRAEAKKSYRNQSDSSNEQNKHNSEAQAKGNGRARYLITKEKHNGNNGMSNKIIPGVTIISTDNANSGVSAYVYHDADPEYEYVEEDDNDGKLTSHDF